ncbi:MAG: KpsF/GutQ family sugar-phosphate isomerase [Candidatus Glassbacteria bacterium]|nr:KpsF/GutQ family sugar-phosphate isomerase [Candidatus Glassbacteria bacterium]
MLEQARRVIGIERDAVDGLLGRLDNSFPEAVELICSTAGRVIVSGVGKSGIVGRKIAATLTSTGTPAIFVHPVDFMHGDIGLVSRDDTFLAISKSGESTELEQMLHHCKRLGIKVIALTGKRDSMLSSLSDVVLDAGVAQEACPHDLAPTASSTAAMVMGDALAVSLLVRRDFKPEDFARLHPAGALGRQLLLRVREVMVTGEDIGKVGSDAGMKDALLELVAKRGICAVIESDGSLAGVVTDGDFKRLLARSADFIGIPVAEVMNTSPKFIHPDNLCVEAVEKMESHSIISMPVVDESGGVVGMVHLHDLMRARII